jgi:predicted NAD/FAD-binding protein
VVRAATADRRSRALKIAIIGSGISGLTAAHLLHRRHDITLFEAESRLGGHTHTHDIELAGRNYAVDTGFIVFNERTYPNFVRLLEQLGVASQPSEMSFGVSCGQTGIEYSGTSLNSLFAQRGNLLRWSFLRMLGEIVRFNRVALREAAAVRGERLGEFLARQRFSAEFVERYLLPMGAAIWSTRAERMLDFPAALFVRFFENHGLLTVDDQPQWRVVSGGSRRYVEALVQPFEDRIRLAAPVARVRRLPHRDGGGVEVAVEASAEGATPEIFDHAILAVHADQALAMLAEPSAAESEVLRCFPYQPNEAVLHTDRALLPRQRRAWASWNFHIPPEGLLSSTQTGCVTLTYDMRTLQTLDCPEPILVTLNRTDQVDPSRILRRLRYHHPAFDLRSMTAQERHGEISGVGGVHYCGAYWGFGFHEDGVRSALAVCEQFGERL